VLDAKKGVACVGDCSIEKHAEALVECALQAIKSGVIGVTAEKKVAALRCLRPAAAARRITETLIVILSVPFALVCGVWLMSLLHHNLSVAVGFIALAGVAAETGVVMLI
jgi:hypothetical protein